MVRSEPHTPIVTCFGDRCSEHTLVGSHCLCIPYHGCPSQGDQDNTAVQVPHHFNSSRLTRDALVLGARAAVSGNPTSKVKVGVLRPVQQPGSYWDRSSELPLVGLEPTEVTAYD